MTRQPPGITTIIAFCHLCLLLTSLPLGAGEPVTLKPNARDKCPVCGMFVAMYPDWTTAIRFQDGSHVFFDGAKDLFKYLLEPNKYDPARRRGDHAAVMVKDYYSLSEIDGRKAWYVLGSDVFGPMGRELIALETETAAREFRKDHKGTKIVRFSDVTLEVMKTVE